MTQLLFSHWLGASTANPEGNAKLIEANASKIDEISKRNEDNTSKNKSTYDQVKATRYFKNWINSFCPEIILSKPLRWFMNEGLQLNQTENSSYKMLHSSLQQWNRSECFCYQMKILYCFCMLCKRSLFTGVSGSKNSFSNYLLLCLAEIFHFVHINSSLGFY